MVKEVLKEFEKKMKLAQEHFRKELSKLRTGRANIHIFEEVKVNYYGQLLPINQVATLSIPDPRWLLSSLGTPRSWKQSRKPFGLPT